MNWQTVEKEIDKLSKIVRTHPDIIIGIARGGLVPARLIASKLSVKEMYCLTVKKDGTERKVANNILVDLQDKKVLLMEDVLESGRSLLAAKEYLEKLGALVETIAIYTTPETEIEPDYFIKQLQKVPSFPWE